MYTERLIVKYSKCFESEQKWRTVDEWRQRVRACVRAEGVHF